MVKGLVFGKFMPVHKGHQALVEFALQHCDELYLVLCHTSDEPISGETRLTWLEKIYHTNSAIKIIDFEYDETILPNTSVSSKEVSWLWAQAFKNNLPAVDILFTSEVYGDYLAEYLQIQHLIFDNHRLAVPISATQIRQNPVTYWEYIPVEIRYWFVKKICIVGSESTGKSTLTEKLALTFNTSFVPEMAREIIEKTEECTFNDLVKIAELHAFTIKQALPTANKLLFVDTDVNITKSYSEFLFQKPLIVEDWVESENNFDLYLFLENDCEYVQDGTRLSIDERNELNLHHKKHFEAAGIVPVSISGNWNERFDKACHIIREIFFSNT